MNFNYAFKELSHYKENIKIDGNGKGGAYCYRFTNHIINEKETIILPDLNCYFIRRLLKSGIEEYLFVGPRTKAIRIKRFNRVQTDIIQIPATSIL